MNTLFVNNVLISGEKSMNNLFNKTLISSGKQMTSLSHLPNEIIDIIVSSYHAYELLPTCKLYMNMINSQIFDNILVHGSINTIKRLLFRVYSYNFKLNNNILSSINIDKVVLLYQYYEDSSIVEHIEKLYIYDMCNMKGYDYTIIDKYDKIFRLFSQHDIHRLLRHNYTRDLLVKYHKCFLLQSHIVPTTQYELLMLKSLQ